ncbi:MAG: VWA domain-containing protein [Bryobacter sp.]|jgi:Ca-activated chloride channel family protein|nr:VWA domain-containing protein [Bryobacter sp. CoA8 C33]
MLRRSFLFTPALLAQIRVEVSLVNVPFTVRDSNGAWITDLNPSDFEVFEDGIPQKISFFSRAADSPLTIAILADTSGSQDDFIRDHRRDIRHFLSTVMTPRDQSLLVCFSDTIRLVSPPGKQPDKLDEDLKSYQKRRNIKDYPRLGEKEIYENASAVYDGIVETARYLGSLTGRRAIILLSDGEDNTSARNLYDAVEALQEFGVTLFSLRYSELRKNTWSARNKYGRATMTRLSLESGGLDFDASASDDLRNEFRLIATMLRATYDLAYTSSESERDGVFRKIRIRAKRPGLTTRHKTGYYARP